MPSKNRARRAEVTRRYFHRRYAQGRCARCPNPRLPEKRVCLTCVRAESQRRLDYDRRVRGVQPRYPTGRGYGPRMSLVRQPLSTVLPRCPRCAGRLQLVQDESLCQRCLNCGYRGWIG